MASTSCTTKFSTSLHLLLAVAVGRALDELVAAGLGLEPGRSGDDRVDAGRLVAVAEGDGSRRLQRCRLVVVTGLMVAVQPAMIRVSEAGGPRHGLWSLPVCSVASGAGAGQLAPRIVR